MNLESKKKEIPVDWPGTTSICSIRVIHDDLLTDSTACDFAQQPAKACAYVLLQTAALAKLNFRAVSKSSAPITLPIGEK